MLLFRQNNSFEFWLSPGPQAGAFAHNDGYCESVISTQLNGAKRWRMMMMPEMKTTFDSFDEFDAGVCVLAAACRRA